ncbi:uncharacterized protein LOC129287400 isoform X2 [Prosopis cineraria]|uniref:uncharacterized protein LOC129287400 isoform X2 n=1 Tax=Prosopis cineraria TaxID=364024 RepID=UPI00241004C4|nr:uncharacterized protein LOC129287400 isoform X2 [Prosopis cineraria]
MGATDVIASVKAELGKPNSLQPNKGAGIDFSLFLAVLGKICWELYIDGLVVSSDGNLLDALGASIKNTLLLLKAFTEDLMTSCFSSRLL